MTDVGADHGLPLGTWQRCVELADRCAAQLGDDVVVDRSVLAWHLCLPAATGDLGPLDPTAVVATPDGAVHADLTDADRDAFDRLRATMPDAGAETLASAAQIWRLPVTPYRPWRGATAGSTSTAIDTSISTPPLDVRSVDSIRRDSPLSGVRVVDLTAMWAGPLCTHLLAQLGANVTTIESSARPDGLRGSPGHFAALDIGKTRLDLDLRRANDRSSFEALVEGADLVIESFSRRVMPNFGYSPEQLRELNGRVTSLAIRAFPAGSAEQDWVAYGPGVHAASGHGCDGRNPRPARFAYADPLTGLAALGLAVATLQVAMPPPALEVAMADVVDGLRPVALGADGATPGCVMPPTPVSGASLFRVG